MNNRIVTIADAATLLFLRQGYARTQISHIAKAAGISVGSIYNDFVGKREIMHFVLKCTIDPEFAERDFERPITDDLFGDIEREVVVLFERSNSEFSAHLTAAPEQYRFEDLISDSFDLLSRYAVGSLFIEKNQYDFKFLADHYKAYRKQFFMTMTAYMNRFMEGGTVRTLERVDLAVTMIVEILAWWAMDRCYISFELSDIPMDQAKAVCMDTIITAYKK